MLLARTLKRIGIGVGLLIILLIIVGSCGKPTYGTTIPTAPTTPPTTAQSPVREAPPYVQATPTYVEPTEEPTYEPVEPVEDVDVPDVNWPSPGDQGLPDGALTGGYCARKWWC